MIATLKEKLFPRNREMVQYWKNSDSVEAKLTRSRQGHMEMFMHGEKYPFPGHPRGSLLYGQLSPLKHEIKNRIFNETWRLLEEQEDDEVILTRLKEYVIPEIFTIGEKTHFDLVPEESLIPAVKEIWRALTVIEQGNEKICRMKEILCFILQEDDGYRNRVQWLAKFFPNWWKPSLREFDFALSMLEHAEVIGDMKERQRLLRRVLMFVLKDPSFRRIFDAFLREVDWKKVRLTKADKYFFRAKWFKVDYPEYSY